MNYFTADDIVEIAREWIGTPYRHQMSRMGVGCDCLGLLRGVYRMVYVSGDPEEVPNYSASWGDHRMDDPLLEIGDRYFHRLPPKTRQVGDVIMFRMKRDMAVKHCGIASHENHMVHAYSGHAVQEDALTDWWQKKIVATFRFKELV